MDSSLPSLMYQRSAGISRSIVFRDEISVQKSSRLSLLDNPQVASPHTGAIHTLKVDRREGRFLLSGSADATVCIYDLSKWGKDRYFSRTKDGALAGNAVYKPIARSVRVPFGDDALETPHGHSHSVVAVEWYPIDAGAFLSASSDGSLLVWDTHAMEPVIRWNPMDSITCMHLSTSQGRSESLLAVGSVDDPFVRLMDIRSGAASHCLVGHTEGVTCLEWSPASDVVIASGSLDGSIRLWDIRKSGSRSCLAILDRDKPFDTSTSKPFDYSLSHLSVSKVKASPNNYRNSEQRGVVSHGGTVSSLSFTSTGSYLVSTGTDGKLQIWDLLGGGHMIPRNFSSRANQAPVSRNRTRLPLLLQACGREAIAWVGHGSQILGYSLDKGGLPVQTLDGHMHMVTCLERVDHSMQLFSAAMDGMICAWGSGPSGSRKRSGSSNANTDDDRRKRIREGRMSSMYSFGLSS